MCSGNKLAANPEALMLNKILLFLTNAFKGGQENKILSEYKVICSCIAS